MQVEDDKNNHFQFSLRGLLTLFVVVAFLGLAFRIAWHIAIPIASVVLVVASTVVARRAFKRKSSLAQRVTTTWLAFR